MVIPENCFAHVKFPFSSNFVIKLFATPPIGLRLYTPSELGSMLNVELVCLQNQFLAGSLPTELGQLRALDLRLNDMRLSRLMPSEMWLNEALHILHLGGNGIAGPFNLPLAMGRTTSLVDVRLQNMELTGSIPAQIGQ